MAFLRNFKIVFSHITNNFFCLYLVEEVFILASVDNEKESQKNNFKPKKKYM